VLVDSGAYRCRNLGDVAMTRVAIARVRARWPTAAISVIVSDAAAAERYFPGVEPLLERGRAEWFADNFLLGRLHRFLPAALQRRMHGLEARLRRRWPRLVAAIVDLRLRRLGARGAPATAFVTALRDADLLLVSGEGGLTDHAVEHMHKRLDTLQAAAALGKPTVMLGQGIGPLHDPSLRAHARSVLPAVTFIGLREGRLGPALLTELGVAPERTMVTGDEAIEPAYARRRSALGDAIGLNVRVTRSAAVDRAVADRVAAAVQEVAGGLGAGVVPVAVEPDDALVVPTSTGAGSGERWPSLDALLERVACCRVVVCGAYHAAVFALSQGIPVVGLARSEYFIDKFLGLATQFGAGLVVLRLDQPDGPGQIAGALRRLWGEAEGLREPLLAAACRQMAAAREAERRMAALLV
jgi:colanic acid/amylovoran biosynthesis protein